MIHFKVGDIVRLVNNNENDLGFIHSIEGYYISVQWFDVIGFSSYGREYAGELLRIVEGV